MKHEQPSEQLVESSPRVGEPRVHLHLRLRALELAFAGVPPFVAGRTRTYAMRAAGLRIGKASIFWGLPTLVGSGAFERRLSVGSDCGFNAGCFFDLEESITIGDHVAAGHDVMFLTTTSRRVLAAGSAGAPRRGPIVVGNGVWLGARAMVLPGVTIGKSSVIGAGVVVSDDVPENTLLTGATKLSIARWR